MDTDIRVERATSHPKILIYDRFGGAGDISLTEEEAEFVRDRLEEVLEE